MSAEETIKKNPMERVKIEKMKKIWNEIEILKIELRGEHD